VEHEEGERGRHCHAGGAVDRVQRPCTVQVAEQGKRRDRETERREDLRGTPPASRLDIHQQQRGTGE
jgi:hypothetical protein